MMERKSYGSFNDMASGLGWGMSIRMEAALIAACMALPVLVWLAR